MARLKQLPTEVQARICEFVGNIADAPSDFQPDPLRQDTFFPVHGEPETTAIEPTYSSIYKDLRSLALTSKAFTDSAQRVLFRIAVVGGPRCFMRLLKSLLIYPKNRRYIRSLFVTRKAHSRRDQLAKETLVQFIQELRPLVLTRRIDELYDASFFRGFEAGLPLGESYWAHPDPNEVWIKMAHEFPREFLLIVADHVLRAIIQLCPFLSGFHICCGDNWPPPRGRTEVPASLDDGPSNTFPQLKSLTLDYGALQARVGSIAIRPRYPGGCPPNVERLTLMGRKESRGPLSELDLDYIHSWIRSNTTLKELRVVNGFDYYVKFAGTVPLMNTWNTILPLFKDTLELLVFDGYRRMPLTPQARFGPTRMLSCLEEFKKLAYLKVPLPMLRDDYPRLCLPRRGQNVLDLVQAKFPKGLKRVDIMVVKKKSNKRFLQDLDDGYDGIDYTKTFQVRL